jgi:hypothetical protein
MTKVLTTLLGALGLAYACLWWSFERFYGEFGVSPQDVGLAPSGGSSDLAGAALQLGIWLVIVLVVMAFLPVAAVVAVEVGNASSANVQPWVYVLAVLLLALTGVVYWWLVDGWVGLALLAGAVLVFAVLIIAARLISLSGHASLVGLNKVVTLPRLASGIALASAVVGITFIDLPTDAAQAGACAATTVKSVPSLNLPVPGLHLPILGVHAQQATLVWLSGTAPAYVPVNQRVVYLGQANGSVVVFDRASKQTTRIPAGDIAVEIKATGKCPGVH